MDISAIDKNLRIQTALPVTNVAWYDGAQPPFRLFGAHIPFRRLPEDVAAATSENVANLARHTAGVRLRFATNSPYIAIKVQWPSLDKMSHMPLSGSAGFDIYRLVDGQTVFAGAFVPPFEAEHGYESLWYTKEDGLQEYELNFPLYNGVQSLYVGIQEGSTLSGGTVGYKNDKPVVFYGSSITQGGCASRPGNAYQGFLSRALNMDYLNLGFSGSCHGEPAIARYMAGLDMAAFVCDFDHNAVDAAELDERHYALYQTIRAAHPTVPYVMVSRPWREDTPEGRARQTVLTQSFLRACEAGDQHVYFVDGHLFFPADAALGCTVDGCHPTDLGFYYMAKGLEPVLRSILYK